MSFTIDLLHYKFTAKFDNLIGLSNFVKNIFEKYSEYSKDFKIEKDVKDAKDVKNVKKNLTFIDYLTMNDMDYDKFNMEKQLFNLYSDIIAAQYKYNDITSYIMSEYYCISNDESCSQLNEMKIKDNFDKYQTCITSGNFANLTDNYMNSLKKLIEKIRSMKDFNKFIEEISIKDFVSDDMTGTRMVFNEIINKYIENYNENDIKFYTKIKPINDCVCGAKMIMDSITSYKICESCGCQIYMPGTVFDDTQFYNQNGQLAKGKKYDSDRHCLRWIEQIQAIEDMSGSALNDVIEKLDKRAIKEYTKNGILRSMKNMKCNQIREWLKDYGLTTKWNDHTPLLRKIITGLHGEAVVPPQLTKEEQERVLADFTEDMNLYEKLCKDKNILELIDRDKVKNRPYYPFGLYKSLARNLEGDPRLPALIESIHFQSNQTIIKNDKIYKIICEKRKKKYTPTDKTILFEIS